MNKDEDIYDELKGNDMDMTQPAVMTDFEFMQSTDIGELSDALCKAQGAMTGAVKDSTNPFFKSKYADLSAVWEDVRKPFADNGISIIQMPCGGIGSVTVITQLTHGDQWIRSRLTMVPVKGDPQGIGSCITYARRYSLAAMAGVYQIDDDANSASKPEQIAPDTVDMIKVNLKADKAIKLIDADSEDYSGGESLEILDSLSNDERIALQGVLKGRMVEGTRKTYFGAFKEHMALERKLLKETVDV